MARRIACAAALCALAAGIPATSALAHEGNPNYESLVNGVTPSIPGFRVQVLNGDDRLEVENGGSSTVTIDGYNRDPYIRMSPGGRVEVNLRSPAYYLNQDRFYGTKVPAYGERQGGARDPAVEGRRAHRPLRVPRPPHALDGQERAPAGHRQGQAHEDRRLAGARARRRARRARSAARCSGAAPSRARRSARTSPSGRSPCSAGRR